MTLKNRRGIAALLIGTTAMVAPALAYAQATSSSSSAPAVQEVVVTGTQIKRFNTETVSPVQVITANSMKLSGYTSITDVLQNVTANGAGALSSNNSEAFAGGASGLALRGLSVADTLVLIDGHRVAPYALSDDGERQFTDIKSIPFDAIADIEVLKDGGSAIYGSDAIAGVVNIKLKKALVGFNATAEYGDSQHGGGATQHYAASYGVGDLAVNGTNAFIDVEYHKQDGVLLSQRQGHTWSATDFTNLGGNNLTDGAPNIFNSNLPATSTPYLVNNNLTTDNPAAYTFLGAGCTSYANLTAGKCGYSVPMELIEPNQNYSILGSFTHDFAGGWELNVKGTYFDSTDQQQSTGPINAWQSNYPGASYAGQTANQIGQIPVPGVGATTFVLPAGSPNNPTGSDAYLEGAIPGFGIPTIKQDSKSYRLVADLTGHVWGWDLDLTGGLTKSEAHVTLNSFVNYATLYTDLLSGAFIATGGNSAAELAHVAPQTSYTATDTLNFLDFGATRPLFKFENFDLSIATGFSIVDKNLKNPGDPAVLAGLVGGTFSTYAIGEQTDIAEYVELDGNIFKQLEIDAALRDDDYNTTGNSLTPKIGFKWRGNYSQGFRAPTAAENGRSSTLFGLGLNYSDPILCGNDAGAAAGQVPSSCTLQPGFQQSTNPLKPETSTSESIGVVLEPIKGWITTFDYYTINIQHQIVSESEFSTYQFANCLRGPDIATSGVSDGNGNLVTAVPLAGPIAVCSVGYINANQTKTDGFDIDSTYRFDTPWNSHVTLSGSYSYILGYSITNQGVTYQLAGTHGPSGVSGDTGNPRDRLNVTAAFDKGPFNLTATINRIGPVTVTDPSAQGNDITCQGAITSEDYAFIGTAGAPSTFCNVKAFTTVNMVATYKVNPHLTLHATIDNLLDSTAPTDFATYAGEFLPYNPVYADGIIGRFIEVGATVKF
jgi:iron complex outermembrane receptor protein